MWFFEKKKYDVFRVVATAVVFDEQKRVLLGFDDESQLWKLPGGKVEKGEAPWVGLQRELQEEIHTTVTVKRLAGMYSYRKDDIDVLFLSFIATLDGEPKISKESSKIAYFSGDQLPSEMSKRMRERIKDAIADLPAPVLKLQE
jgi:ADP-ribose pyrophosphatase YjhB (NUDIX family)